MVTNVVKEKQEILLSIKRIGINGEGIGYYKRLAKFVSLFSRSKTCYAFIRFYLTVWTN